MHPTLHGKDQGWDDNTIGLKMIELQNKGKAYTSDLLWYPINQIAFTAFTKFGFTKSKIDTSDGFYHWGDYGDRSDCGFIFGTQFQDCVSVYLTTGKDIAILQEWVRKNLPNRNPKTKDYIEQWMAGTVFASKPKDGTLVSRSKAISYKAASFSGSSGSSSSVKKTDKKIAIIGDYPIDDVSSTISTSISKTPWENFKINGKRGRTLNTVRQNQTIKTVKDVIKELKTSNFVPDAYIIAAGNADTFLYGSLEQYQAAIEDVINEIGDKKVYWFNVYNNSTTTDISRSTLFNQALDNVRAKKPNLLNNTLLDWDSSVFSKPDYMDSKGRAFSETGKIYFASLIEQACNNLAGLIQSGSYDASSPSVPTFTSDQIAEAALWLSENRMVPWIEKNGDGFGCEGFANRLASGLGILGATKNYSIFTNDWPKEIPTTLTTFDTAQAHYQAIKNKKTFFKKTTDKGDKPPKGYLVFWTGGTGSKEAQGHVGISLGNDSYIDQSGQIRKISGSDKPGGYPGQDYAYVGSSSSWV